MKPEIFIGSSVEGLQIADEIELILQHKFKVTKWTTGVFNIGNTPLEDLLTQLSKSDFGLFIFSPDDKSIIRNDEYSVIRDNVLYELGLYTGKLGNKNTFIIKPANVPKDFHLPSDLNGINIGDYDNKRIDNLSAAVSPFCSQVTKQIFNSIKYPLTGEWKFTWKVKGSKNYGKINSMTVHVFQYEDFLKFEYQFNDTELYKFHGTLKGKYLSGFWSHKNEIGYNGTFQMELLGNGTNLKGVWTGWSTSRGIKSGECLLEK